MATVQLEQGTYRGLEKDGVHAFHALPYCAPYQRFQSPAKVKLQASNSDPIDATSFGPCHPQSPSGLQFVMGPMPTGAGAQDEANCGVLSVYRPTNVRTDDTPLPVIVWIHGGAFVTGGSQIPWYEGSRLARDAASIVVCINYRLGVFGYLYDEERSLSSTKLPCGTEDVITAFEWVRDNIDAFGGDSNNITAVGHSAGGYHIQCLLDLKPDLFQRAILQSPPAGLVLLPEQGQLVRESVKANLPPSTTLETASTKDLLVAQGKAMRTHAAKIMSPSLPISIENKAPGGNSIVSGQNQKQILLGWTKDDGAAFAALGVALAGFPDWMIQPTAYGLGPSMTRSRFSIPCKALAERLRQQGHRVTIYTLDWQPEGFELGATHTCELPLLFGDEEAWKNAPMLGYVPWAEWERRGKTLRQIWGRFAREGLEPAPGEMEHLNLH